MKEERLRLWTLGLKVRGSRTVPDSAEVRAKEVRDAIERINCGKSLGMDGVKVRC